MTALTRKGRACLTLALCHLRGGTIGLSSAIEALTHVNGGEAGGLYLPPILVVARKEVGVRLVRARLALLLRAILRADRGDVGRLVCTCFGEPRDVATHRDARHCIRPHPLRFTPLWVLRSVDVAGRR